MGSRQGRLPSTHGSQSRIQRRSPLLPRALLLLAACLFAAGCAESRATKLAERAEPLAKAGKYDEAIAILERVESAYPATRAGRGARRRILLYQGLRDAELKSERRRAKDEMLAIARGLLEFQEAHHRYPESLASLDPIGLLPRKDPWSRFYEYRSPPGGASYRLQCLGADGVAGGAGDDLDLLVVSGNFVKDLPWEDR